MVRIFITFATISLYISSGSICAAQDIVFDNRVECGEAMAAALPSTLPLSSLRTLDSARGTEADRETLGAWSEFLKVAFRLAEHRFQTGSQLRIAEKMPFEDVPGSIRNPGCYSRSYKYILIARGLIDFAFDTQHPERSATAVGVVFHELGHAFQQRPAFVVSQQEKTLEDYLWNINAQATELFSDYFAGYLFYFWHRYVRSSLNINHPVYSTTLLNISSFDMFRFTFRYFGCYASKKSLHGDYTQRHDAFVQGAVTAEKTGKRAIDDLDTTDLDTLASTGASAVFKIADRPTVTSLETVCVR